jgi:hypothetical protein
LGIVVKLAAEEGVNVLQGFTKTGTSKVVSDAKVTDRLCDILD